MNQDLQQTFQAFLTPLSRREAQTRDELQRLPRYYTLTVAPPGYVIDRDWAAGGPIVFRPAFAVVDEHGTRLLIAVTNTLALSFIALNDWLPIHQYLRARGEKLLILAFDDGTRLLPPGRELSTFADLQIRDISDPNEIMPAVMREFTTTFPAPCMRK